MTTPDNMRPSQILAIRQRARAFGRAVAPVGGELGTIGNDMSTSINLDRGTQGDEGHFVTIEGHVVFIKDDTGHGANGRGGKFTRHAIETKILDHHKERGGDEAELHRTAGDRIGDTGQYKTSTDRPFHFKGDSQKDLPGEVQDWIDGDLHRRSLFTVSRDGSARGADVMSEMGGDQYFAMAEEALGGKLNAAKKTARKSDDPEIRFLAAMHDDMPKTKTATASKTDFTGKWGRAKMKVETFKVTQGIMPTAKLREGHTFTINGSPMSVVNVDGELHLQGSGYPSTPLEALREVPIDKHSLKMGRRLVSKEVVPFSAAIELMAANQPRDSRGRWSRIDSIHMVIASRGPGMAEKHFADHGVKLEPHELDYVREYAKKVKTGHFINLPVSKSIRGKIDAKLDATPANLSATIELARAELAGGRWVTIHPHGDEGSYVRLYIKSGGKIAAGPKSMVGKDIGHLHDTHEVRESDHPKSPLKRKDEGTFTAQKVDPNKQLGMFAKDKDGNHQEVGEKAGQGSLFHDTAKAKPEVDKAQAKRDEDAKATTPMFDAGKIGSLHPDLAPKDVSNAGAPKMGEKAPTDVDSLLKSAEKHSEHGPDYNRNIAAPAGRIRDAMARGHAKDSVVVGELAKELKVRLEGLPASKPTASDAIAAQKAGDPESSIPDSNDLDSPALRDLKAKSMERVKGKMHSDEIGDVLKAADKYSEKGENYNRNIADPAARIRAAIARGHANDSSVVTGLVSELRGRLDGLRSGGKRFPSSHTEAGDLGVYTVQSGGKAMYSVHDAKNNPRGFGDTLHETPEAAAKEGEWIKQRRDDRAKMDSNNAAKTKADADAKAKREDVKGFAGDANARDKGKAVASLSKMVSINGVGKSIRDHVENMVASGGVELTTYEESKIKPMTSRQSFRASNEDQQAHEKRMKEAGTQTVYLVNGYRLGKTGYEYAKHLIGKVNLSACCDEVIKNPTEVRDIDVDLIDHAPGDASMKTADDRAVKIAAKLARAIPLPPIKVMPKKNGRYVVLDGNARLKAHKIIGRKKAVCEVIEDKHDAKEAKRESVDKHAPGESIGKLSSAIETIRYGSLHRIGYFDSNVSTLQPSAAAIR